jgi:glycosyltransferase involved in cell wall biosynthesis
MIENPLVTVLIPVFNAEKYLREAIESILNQTYKNLEILIINDGSTDQSEDIILSYSDDRIRYIKNQQNIKLISTLNLGIKEAKGKYIARMDADDVSMLNRIEKQVRFLEENPSYILCGSNVKLIKNDQKTDEIIHYHNDSSDIKFALAFYCPFIHPTVLIRKEILVIHNLFYDSMFLHAEDYHLWTKLVDFGDFINLQDELVYYRIHEHQISSEHKEFQKLKMKEIQNQFLIKRLKDEFSNEEIEILFGDGNSCVNQNINLFVRFLRNGSFEGNFKERYINKKIRNLISESNDLNFVSLFQVLRINKIRLNSKEMVLFIFKCLTPRFFKRMVYFR